MQLGGLLMSVLAKLRLKIPSGSDDLVWSYFSQVVTEHALTKNTNLSWKPYVPVCSKASAQLLSAGLQLTFQAMKWMSPWSSAMA